MRRWLIYGLFGLCLVLLLTVTGGVLWVTQADLRPWVEAWASESLGRKVTATKFEIDWGDPLTLRIRDLRIANASWGSKADMVSLGSLDAVVDAQSLWTGRPAYRQLRVNGLEVVLERNESGTGNWKFGDGSGSGGGGILPKDRTQFPTLIDMVLEQGLITYRTYSGNILRIALHKVAIVSSGDDTPVTLTADGAYNDTPLTLVARTESFRSLHDANHPFETELTLAGRTVRLDFRGTMMEPLDVDGLDGTFKLDAPELDNLLAAFGSDVAAAYSLILEGKLTRQGDHWEFGAMKGAIARMPLTGTLMLDEGRRGSPDSIAADLSFDALKIDALMGEAGGITDPDWRQQAMLSPRNAGVNLDLALTAHQLSYGTAILADFSGKLHLGGMQASLSNLAFGIAGGKVTGDAHINAAGGLPRLSMAMNSQAIDADRLAQTLGAPAGDITGKIDGLAELSGEGDLLGDVAVSTTGNILVAMTGGSIRESLIEKASTDLRALFREEEGNAAIRCLGLRISLAEGRAVLRRMRLRAEGATLDGVGGIDLTTSKIEIRLESQRAASGFFALDLPIRIAGTPDHISAGLAPKDQPAPSLPSADDTALSPAMRQLSAGNACLN